MHDASSLHGLTDAAARWSGHHAALTARLGQPGAVRLTEEQEALALGIARRLVFQLASGLPLKTPVTSIWARWESAGLPSAALLAPSIFARVEEYRWRRMMTGPLHDPLPGLFAESSSKRRGSAVPTGIDAAHSAAIDAALLDLRIVDGGRSDPFGLPLLLPPELPQPALRALLFDTGAQDLAQAGDMNSRSPEIAAAVEQVLASHTACPIDAASRAYVVALEQGDFLAPATANAISRHDWLAVIAVAAIKGQRCFADTAALLVAADEAVVQRFFVALGLTADAVTPLLDSLAEIPGRPSDPVPPPTRQDSEDLVQAVAARAEELRVRQQDAQL
jgi:hypothetical protein